MGSAGNNVSGFSWLEVEEYGEPLYNLRPGDWFAVVLATEDGLSQETVTGKLIYPGIGSALVQLDRSWDKLVRWCPDCKVIPLPKPKTSKTRVSLDPANFDYGEENE